MTPSSKYRIKAVSVLGIFFCLGIFASHFLLRMIMRADQPVQSDVLENHEKNVETQVHESHQPVSTMLVSVSLPAPPPARSDKEKASHNETKRSAAIEPKVVSESRPETETETETLVQEHELIDTQQDTLIQQGLSLLRNARQDVPQIQIQLPVDAEHSEQVINTLRACMGVTLGQLSQAGEVVVQENAGQPASPFVRLVEGRLSRQEQQLADQWQSASGTMVRFYPETADARVLGGLLQLVKGPLAHKKISGEYRIQNGELNLVNIKINGSESQTRLRLSKLC